MFQWNLFHQYSHESMDGQVTANYIVAQQERQPGLSFYCFKSFENVTFKSIHIYTCKKVLLTLIHVIYDFTVS